MTVKKKIIVLVEPIQAVGICREFPLLQCWNYPKIPMRWFSQLTMKEPTKSSSLHVSSSSPDVLQGRGPQVQTVYPVVALLAFWGTTPRFAAF